MKKEVEMNTVVTQTEIDQLEKLLEQFESRIAALEANFSKLETVVKGTLQ